MASAPFTFDLKQVDLSYDFMPKRGGLIQSFAMGVRYFDYTLPRILYEFVNSTPDAETPAYVYSRETPPQRMRTRYYMGTLTARFEKPLTPHHTPYLRPRLRRGLRSHRVLLPARHRGRGRPQ